MRPIFLLALPFATLFVVSSILVEMVQGINHPVSKPLYLYFKEMVVVTDRLATWQPNDENGLPGAQNDLHDLFGKMNVTIQVLQEYQGQIDQESANAIATSIEKMTDDVVKLSENIKSAQETFIKFNTTQSIVAILQSFGNQSSLIFTLLQKRESEQDYSKLEDWIHTMICAIDCAIETLDHSACVPQSQAFCSAYQVGVLIPIDPEKVCIDNQINGS